jgi:hypothetical protein
MRMWMVNPKIMCRKHLLGEHVELHMFVGTILLNKALTGCVENGLVEVHNIKSRHASLVDEMEFRGMKHKSPLKDFTEEHLGEVDRESSLEDLLSHCPECLSKFQSLKGD